MGTCGSMGEFFLGGVWQKGHYLLRQRLLCSTASETKVQIENTKHCERTEQNKVSQVDRSQTPNHICLQGD